MPHIILTVKLVYVWLYHGALSLIAAAAGDILLDEKSDKIVVMIIIGFAVLGIMIPEICLVSFKGFREWIKQGVEDSDGKLNKSDLQDAMMLYTSLWAMRVFVAFSIVKMFGVPIDNMAYMTALFGSFGIAGLPVLKSIFAR